MKVLPRPVLLLCLTLVVLASAWTSSGLPQDSDWIAVKRGDLDPARMQGSFFKGPPLEVAARISRLALLRADPSQRTVGFEDRHWVSRSFVGYHAYSPDNRQGSPHTATKPQRDILTSWV